MLEFELLNCLFVTNPSTPVAKGREPISQETYFSLDVDLLSCYLCPTCCTNALFRGFFFIQCRECSNCFLDESELTQLIISHHSGKVSLSSG
jgi:hypothetical protein